MKIHGRHPLPGTREQVWRLLNDPVLLAKCLPGCERLDPDGPDRYRATIRFALAAISGKYSSSVELTEKDPPRSLRMRVEGKGTPGFLNGEGRLDLVEGKGQTEVRYEGEARVGGLIAAVGQRMIEAAAHKIIQQFLESAAALLRAPAGPSKGD